MTERAEDTATVPIDPEEVLETARDEAWEKVETALDGAAGAAWDECHKIYVLRDAGQVARMRELGYPVLVDRTEGGDQDRMDDAELLEAIEEWFAGSCMLRFVEAVRSVPAGSDPNTGFEALIEQAHPAFNHVG